MKSRKKVAFASFIMSTIMLGGCGWDASLYNKFAVTNLDDNDNKVVSLVKCQNNAGELDYIKLDKQKCTIKNSCDPNKNPNCVKACEEFEDAFKFHLCPAKYGNCEGNGSETAYCYDVEMPCKDGIICDENCIYPKTSNKYCGAKDSCVTVEERGKNCDEKVQDASLNIDVIACENGECVVKKCKQDYHLEQEVCIKDSIEKCGENQVDCKDKIPHSKIVECMSGECILVECENNYYIKDNACIEANVQNCAREEYDCSIYVPGWESGTCVNKTCEVKKCIKGYHEYQQNIPVLGRDITICEYNSFENCGEHDKSCKGAKECASGLDPVCTLDGECECIECDKLNLTECEKSCVDINSNINHCKGCNINCKQMDNVEEAYCDQEAETNGCVALSCKSGYHLFNRTCKENNDNNCGAEGNACNNVVSNGHCDKEKGTCIIDSCKLGYHRDKEQCVPDTSSSCGENAIDCHSLTGISKVKCDILPDNTNKMGCIIETCQSNYHKSGNECQMDTKEACGNENNKCQEHEFCLNGKCEYSCSFEICYIDGVNVCTDTNINPNHCGRCNNPCLGNLSCVNKECRCKEGLQECGSDCVELNTNEHCGQCDNVCNNKESFCMNGECICIDTTNKQTCNGKCISKEDHDHCGNCDTHCNDNQKCIKVNGNTGNTYKCVLDCSKYDVNNSCPNCYRKNGVECVNKNGYYNGKVCHKDNTCWGI